jgi:hypothetical protein
MTPPAGERRVSARTVARVLAVPVAAVTRAVCVDVALAALAATRLTGALVATGADPGSVRVLALQLALSKRGPRRRMAGAGERTHSIPIAAMIVAAATRSSPGNRISRSGGSAGAPVSAARRRGGQRGRFRPTPNNEEA